MRNLQASSSGNAFQRLVHKLHPPLAAFLATLMALPVNAAITLPDEPLVTGARIPPNVLFVLDNSGSMRYTYLPDAPASVSTANISRQTYTRNMIFYNPYKDYQPWVDSTGVEMTGGRDYNSAYAGTERIPPFDTTTINLQDSVQTFYVPRDSADTSSHSDVAGYYRYQILTSGVVERSEWDGSAIVNHVAPGYPISGISGTVDDFLNDFATFTIPANTARIQVVATGAARANLYVRVNAVPTTGSYSNRVNNTSATKTITRNNPTEGDVIHVAIGGKGSGLAFSGVGLTVTYQLDEPGCTGYGWVDCVAATPTGRTDEAERRNYATWYSYHRTRYKVAKAGAGRAFAEIGSNFRVGYRNIHNDVPTSGSAGDVTWNTHPITRAKPIPVTRNNGLFDDPNGPNGENNNRTAWYQRLYSQTGNSGTPLRKALWTSGDYFENDTSATGPWGPESGTDQYACRQNFTILTTDGYRNDSNTAGFDYTGVEQQVGEQDNTAGPTITGPGGATFTYAPANPYASAHSDNMADIAMRYWKNDLRDDLPNVVPTSSANPAFWQHMVTFAISIGAEGELDPAADLADLTSGLRGWPNPQNNHPTSIDDLWHASVNGRGSFVVATDPDALTNALQNALAEISERTGSSSNVAANSTSLDAGTRVFQANYVSRVWTGQLSAYPIVETVVAGRKVYSVSAVASWQASSGIPLADSRNVFSYDGTAGTEFPSEATDAQLAALARSSSHPYPVTGENNAAYIAGERGGEQANGGVLRNRGHLLGDIVGSSPAYSINTDTVYVGANDGMLHAIDASNGEELFAYLPNLINWSNLRELSNPEYAHKYFVDGPIVVSSYLQTSAKNILVGTLGKGGKGLFALDVTTPDSFSASDVKWEKAETVSPAGNMGYIQGKPIIARLSNGTTALIVGNGINSTNERAVLLVYNLDTGALIRQIDTGVGGSNGLTAPAGWDSDGNGAINYVYAGDMRGNVWKFNLGSNDPASWSVANDGDPLFRAEYPDGSTAQPVTGGVTVAMHPITYRPWVFFGTGRFMTVGDLVDDSVQSFYAFVDEDDTIERSDLTERFVEVVGTQDGKLVRSFEPGGVLPIGSKGWFLDLVPPSPAAPEGERVITEAQVVGDVLVFSSVIPTADACQPDGRGYLNSLDAFTGTSTGPSYFDVDGDGKFDDETLTNDSGDAVPIGSVDIGVGMPSLSGLLRGLAAMSGSGGGTGSVGTRESRNVGRVSWREILKGN